ncbi:MAG: PD-(D/E)XK nuclease family protein [Bacteroidetes bacterium]|nr:PD-(D/E)XK nuclease family protein [Bacteroidota bacterium]
MSIEITKKYLNQVYSIIENYENELDKDGSRFNIFSILNLSSNEVRLHSTFIAELLNPKGSHGASNLYLDLFISQLKKEGIAVNLNTKTAFVEVEKSTGLINKNYTIGGRIDLIIQDGNKNGILIENKIFADDQKNQLLRYYNFNKGALLLYLTLDGNEPSDWSTNKKLVHWEHFYCISYKDFITKWLNDCIRISEKKPRIKETISQYLIIIKDYTQQSQKNNMDKKIIDLIESDKKFYDSIEEIINSYSLFREGVRNKFEERIGAKRKDGMLVCKISDDTKIKYFSSEDGGGFYHGFYIEKNGKEEDNRMKKYAPIADLFMQINPNFETTKHFIGWINSEVVNGKFLSLHKDKIFDLNNETEMEKFIKEIVKEIDQYVHEIKKRVNKMLK